MPSDAKTRVPEALRGLAKHARREGWRIRPTRKGHLLWTSPRGARVVTAGTPGGCRSAANERALLRRHGLRERP